MISWWGEFYPCFLKAIPWCKCEWASTQGRTYCFDPPFPPIIFKSDRFRSLFNQLMANKKTIFFHFEVLICPPTIQSDVFCCTISDLNLLLSIYIWINHKCQFWHLIPISLWTRHSFHQLWVVTFEEKIYNIYSPKTFHQLLS